MSPPSKSAPAWVAFRKHVIDRLWNDDLAGYINPDTFVGHCPLCDGVVAVRFAGRSEVVTLYCYGSGCREADIAREIGLGVIA